VELILPFMEYREAKRYYTGVKAKQRSLHKRVWTFQQKNQPIHDFKKQLDMRLKRLDEQRNGKKEAARRRFRAMGAKRDESEKLVCHSPPCLQYFYLAFPQDTSGENLEQALESRIRKKRALRISKRLFGDCRPICRSLAMSRIWTTSRRKWSVPSPFC